MFTWKSLPGKRKIVLKAIFSLKAFVSCHWHLFEMTISWDQAIQCWSYDRRAKKLSTLGEIDTLWNRDEKIIIAKPIQSSPLLSSMWNWAKTKLNICILSRHAIIRWSCLLYLVRPSLLIGLQYIGLIVSTLSKTFTITGFTKPRIRSITEQYKCSLHTLLAPLTKDRSLWISRLS